MSDNKRNAVVIGITGGIACGKSEVGNILERMGYGVCDADRVAHALMVKGSAVFKNVVECFGDGIVSENGDLSRPALAKIVFEDQERREQLNQLVHPEVRRALMRWIAERRARSEHAAVQIPLLFESGMDDLDFDGIICVSSTEDLVRERLGNRGVMVEEAANRIRSQMPLAEKERLADCVIRNVGSLQELEQATRRALESLLVER